LLVYNDRLGGFRRTRRSLLLFLFRHGEKGKGAMGVACIGVLRAWSNWVSVF